MYCCAAFKRLASQTEPDASSNDNGTIAVDPDAGVQGGPSIAPDNKGPAPGGNTPQEPGNDIPPSTNNAGNQDPYPEGDVPESGNYQLCLTFKKNTEPMTITVDRKFKSERLNALHDAGRMKTSTAVDKGSRSQRSRKSGKSSKAAPAQQLIKIVPFQQLEEGVFIQQVRVKTIKVGFAIFWWFRT